VAAAVLEISYLDPVILDQEPYLFRPWHIGLKVRKKGPGIRPFSLHFMVIHEKAPFSPSFSMRESEFFLCV